MPASAGAVVVGAGPNGLAAAVALAREGVRVVVVEGSSSVGGGARSAPLTAEGFVHDTCSAVHPMAHASPFFAELPLARHGLDWVQPELPLAHALDDRRCVVLERSLQGTAAALGGDGDTYQRLVEPLTRHWPALLDEILRPPLHLPRRPLLMARFGLRALRSAAGLAARFSEPGTRALMAGLAAHAVLPLHRAASAAVAVVLAAAAHCEGWPFPRGGAGRIADALAAHLDELGGEVRLETPVTRLDQLPASPLVLFDLAPSQVARIAGDVLPRRYLRRLQRFRHGPGVFKVDWALAAPIPWQAPACARAGTVHLGGSFEEVEAAIAAPWRGEPAERPFVLLAQPSVFDPTRAPAGRHTAWAYCHVPAGSKVDMTSAVEAQVERFAPGFRRLVLARFTRSAARLEEDNPACVGGDLTGGVPDLGQTLARPILSANPYITPHSRLWLCSASTPPGGGVHGMCGANAARAALARHGR